jgi:predicted nucleic-acid-binding Zn-ribbon protein
MNYKYIAILLAVLLACSITGSVYAIKKPKYYVGVAVECPICGNCQDLDYERASDVAGSWNRWQCPKCGCLFSDDRDIPNYFNNY